jgi:hypothetical protein
MGHFVTLTQGRETESWSSQSKVGSILWKTIAKPWQMASWTAELTSGFVILRNAPFVLSLLLNDYVRFMRPGHHILRVQNSRVSLVPKRAGQRAQPMELSSNAFELTILPTNATWQQTQLREAMELLKSRPGISVEGCEKLRTLGTKAAAAAMVDDYRDEQLATSCNINYGLMQSPERQFAIAQMREKLEDPAFPISPEFLSAMAELTVLSKGQIGGIGSTPSLATMFSITCQ